MGRRGLKYKVGQLEKKIDGLVNKIDDTYKVHPIMFEAYNKDRTNILLAKENALNYIRVEFSNVFSVCSNDEINHFTDEFVQINYAHRRGNAELFCYHYFKLIEFILNKFIHNNPGQNIIQPIIEKPNPLTKNNLIVDLFSSKKKGYKYFNYAFDPKLTVDENKKQWDRILADDKNTLFLRLLYSPNAWSKPRLYINGAQKCPSFDLYTFSVLKYYRDKFSHFGKNVFQPGSNSLNPPAYFTSHFADSSMILRSDDAKKLLRAYLYLYNEYLKGNIVI
jgi:hypothetical protein